MSETRYIISDAAKMIDVEPHVLGYWEEELGMDIPRNEMGHRYYTDKEVRLFSQVRDLKEKGFQLKAIKMILSTISEEVPASNIISLEKVRKGFPDSEQHVQPDAEMMDAVQETDSEPEDTYAQRDTDEEQALAPAAADETKVVAADEKMKHFKYIMDGIMMQALKKNNQELEEQMTGRIIKEMDYLFRLQEEREEERFRSLDENIRKKQKGRKQAAAARMPSYANPKPKKRLFGKKDLY